MVKYRCTIVRKIQQGETSAYRFEKSFTYIKFDGTGTYPASVPSLLNGYDSSFVPLPWKAVIRHRHGHQHRESWFHRTILAMGNWRIRPNTPSLADPSVDRDYIISTDNGANFQAEVQLRYEQSRSPNFYISESNLRLLRGPCFIDTVQSGWHMLSLPLVPEDNRNKSFFPRLLHLHLDTTMHTKWEINWSSAKVIGWNSYLNSLVSILGDDRENDTISVDVGWNLIGHYLSREFDQCKLDPSGLCRADSLDIIVHTTVAQDLQPLRRTGLNQVPQDRLSLHRLQSTCKSLPLPDLDALNSITFCDEAGNTQQLFRNR